METFKRIKIWGNHHHPKWVDYIRIALGLVLIWKGIAFILNLDVLDFYLRDTGIADRLGLSISITVLAHLIIILHLIGGLCIAIGFRTRLFCLFNLPVLLCAVTLINLKQNVFKPYAEFWLSLIVLIAIVGFLIIGTRVENQEEKYDIKS